MSGRPAVVLLSGGLDSATAAAWALREGFRLAAIAIDYGQRHRVELECAADVARHLGLEQFEVVPTAIGRFGGSALTDNEIDVPKGPPTGEIPVTYVPVRNLHFLTIAAARAETLGATDLVIGANQVDYSGYPDCRRPFFDALEATLNLGTKVGVEGRAWRIHTPLIDLTKPQIIELGLACGVDYGLTSSCYDPLATGAPCGRCESCHIRLAAFAELGMDDPRVARMGQAPG
ncbi:MAG: 7-cyano-7-deazaguanine synthase QueC [Candidatus Dadabacteria bacterium]|nr:MAG: 7-cyano-7-deazaguanine synthase QueC [Candidatus Dadabacteria bacterium]